jgi:hypothetical protein
MWRRGLTLVSRDLPPSNEHWRNSSLQESLYEKLADTAMEELLDELQNLLDSHRDTSLEVEYNVCPSCTVLRAFVC